MPVELLTACGFRLVAHQEIFGSQGGGCLRHDSMIGFPYDWEHLGIKEVIQAL